MDGSVFSRVSRKKFSTFYSKKKDLGFKNDFDFQDPALQASSSRLALYTSPWRQSHPQKTRPFQQTSSQAPSQTLQFSKPFLFEGEVKSNSSVERRLGILKALQKLLENKKIAPSSNDFEFPRHFLYEAFQQAVSSLAVRSQDMLQGETLEDLLKPLIQRLPGHYQPKHIRKMLPKEQIPAEALSVEIDWDETLEAFEEPNPLILLEKAFFQVRLVNETPIVLVLDTSLSMEGENFIILMLSAISLMLYFQKVSFSIIGFNHQTSWLKKPYEKPSSKKLIQKFLNLQTAGYTQLDQALQFALKNHPLLKKNDRRMRSWEKGMSFLLTDGKITAGDNPLPIAEQFAKLMVLQIGGGRHDASVGKMCSLLAKKGHGKHINLVQITKLSKIIRTLAKTFHER